MHPDELTTADRGRWPSGAEKCELIDGALVITGRFEEQDVATAERTYPGRRVVLTEDGGIEVHPAGPPQGIWAELGARD